MIVCTRCGHQNKDGEAFCGSCGRSLDLYGEHVPDPAPPQPPPTPIVTPTPEPPRSLIDRAKEIVHLDQPRPEPPQPFGFSVAPTDVIEAPPKTPTRDAIGESVAPSDEAERVPPPIVRKPDRGVQPGDIMCWKCGAGNGPDRNFCRVCGADLKAVPVAPVKLRWYRRLFPARTSAAAGARPRPAPDEGAGVPFGLIALGVIVVLLLAYLVISPLREGVNHSVGSVYASAHKQFFPMNTPVRPSDATASSQVQTHPPKLTIDLITETYWAANAKTDKDLWLRLVFAGPVDITTVLITSGAGNDFASFARPKDVKLVFSDKSVMTLTLKDDPRPQSFDLGFLRHTTMVEIHILSVYPASQSPDVAINEVEFFKVE